MANDRLGSPQRRRKYTKAKAVTATSAAQVELDARSSVDTDDMIIMSLHSSRIIIGSGGQITGVVPPPDLQVSLSLSDRAQLLELTLQRSLSIEDEVKVKQERVVRSKHQVVQAAPGVTEAPTDPNADKIKSLVKRFIKTGLVQESKAKITPPPLKISLVKEKKSTSPLEPACSPSLSSSSIQQVLIKYNLPEDVASAVASAVAAKQLPSNPISLDTLLARLFSPSSKIRPELLHAVLKRSPSALKQTGELLQGKIAALKQALVCSDEELLVVLSSTRNLLGLKADTIKGKLSSLEQVLGLPTSEVCALARKVPHLLSCNSETIAIKFKSLKALVQRPHKEAVGMVLATPQLLFLNEDSLKAKFVGMASLLEISNAACGELVASKPMLLTSSAVTIRERWSEVKRMTSKSNRWTSELKALAPATIASLLLASKVKVKRLAYVVSLEQQEQVSFTSLIMVTPKEFLAKWPAYKP
jgi:hypothetical protein